LHGVSYVILSAKIQIFFSYVVQEVSHNSFKKENSIMGAVEKKKYMEFDVVFGL